MQGAAAEDVAPLEGGLAPVLHTHAHLTAGVATEEGPIGEDTAGTIILDL